MSKIYVTLPKHFVALEKLPGYFWHMKEERLYTMKVTGVLRPLPSRKYYCAYRWSGLTNRHNDLCYKVSIGGRRQTLFVDDLKRMFAETKPKKSTVPVEKR